MRPIFILGRQHSGNTMLTILLGGIPSVLCLHEEGTFFEVRQEIARLPPKQRALRTARKLRDDGIVREKKLWRVIEPQMVEVARGGANEVDLYVAGMKEALAHFGKERWVQKATSYVFLVDDILEAFPEARLVYLTRNPLDLAASIKRRSGGSATGIVRMALGWNRGNRRALRVQAREPERLMVLRYEDLVSEPEASIRSVCAFCDLPFDRTYLDVPHVNKSENPYNLESEQKGLNASRVFYYRDVLDPVEIAAVRLATDAKLVGQLYPELQSAEASVGNTARALGLLARSAASLAAGESRRLVENPSHAFRRALRRL